MLKSHVDIAGRVEKSPNQRIYELDDLVRSYIAQEKLQPPEEAILSTLKPELSAMRMLDLGVGGGRTTVHFAPLVNDYVGVDYSEKMVAACQSRFRSSLHKSSFRVADACSMPEFADGSFDFVLFSYNGLDYVSGEMRQKALHEIRRVLCPGGKFAFSSHNLNALRQRLKLRLWQHPKRFAAQLIWKTRFRQHNPILVDIWNGEKVVVNDGALDFRLHTYYLTPQAQMNDLNETGFSDVRAFNLASGKIISDGPSLEKNKEDWIYYLCSRITHGLR
ncbi:MAG TPA: class I SAM-dependent methyltransferase [Terriglobales bacterium]|nr:class I SAM-dependent methyltransferase [Terriglobales bacterium]